MAVVLITDSGCDLDAVQAQQSNITLVPMTVRFGDTEYLSGVNLSNEEFYTKLTESKELPTTSQPTPYDFEKAFQKIKNAGDEAVVLCVSSALSGTYQSACIAADGLEDCIHVVDSKAVSVAQRILLDYAVLLKEQGLTAKQIAAELEEKKACVCAYGAVDTLEYLIKGGRLSKASGAVGSMLGIRPVLTLCKGALEVAGKARGPKAAVSTTNRLIGEAGVDFSMPYGIGYTGNDPTVTEAYLTAADSVWADRTVPVYQIGSTVGTHTGPGLFMAAFFKKT